MPKRRTRTLVFRVTESEYSYLKSACDAVGERSLSQFIRAELLSAAQSDTVDEDVLLAIDRKLSELSRAAEQILEQVRKTTAAGV